MTNDVEHPFIWIPFIRILQIFLVVGNPLARKLEAGEEEMEHSKDWANLAVTPNEDTGTPL